jgi:hypothetical protein
MKFNPQNESKFTNALALGSQVYRTGSYRCIQAAI